MYLINSLTRSSRNESGLDWFELSSFFGLIFYQGFQDGVSYRNIDVADRCWKQKMLVTKKMFEMLVTRQNHVEKVANIRILLPTPKKVTIIKSSTSPFPLRYKNEMVRNWSILKSRPFFVLGSIFRTAFPIFFSRYIWNIIFKELFVQFLVLNYT